MITNIGILQSSSNKYLLDTYPNAAAAFSLRKVRKDYSGPCIRVRREIGNDEMDIGFKYGMLDTATILTFLDGHNQHIYVVKWYDQSGYGLHAIQEVAISQPTICNSTEIYMQNGKPAIDFTNTSSSCLYISTSALNIGSGDFTSFVVATLTNAAITDGDLYSKSKYGAAPSRWSHGYYNSGIKHWVSLMVNSANEVKAVDFTELPALNSTKIFTQKMRSGAENSTYWNKVLKGQLLEDFGPIGDNPFMFFLGAYNDSDGTSNNPAVGFGGNIQEAIFYLSSQDVEPINDAINSYHHVY